jgi:hypothetical protein
VLEIVIFSVNTSKRLESIYLRETGEFGELENSYDGSYFYSLLFFLKAKCVVTIDVDAKPSRRAI